LEELEFQKLEEEEAEEFSDLEEAQDSL